MNGPPWTSWLALLKWNGTYAQLLAAYPSPSIWTGFNVFTPDKGYCIWFDNQGWVPYSQWNPGNRNLMWDS